MTIITGPLAALKLAQIVAYDSTLNDAAKRVFILIAGHANEEGFCWPSIKKMAKNLCISRQAIIKQINILIEHEYLKKASRYGSSGRRRTNLYQLNFVIANTYQNTPEFFCLRNVTTMVTYLVTILRYREMELNQVTTDVSLLGDINITTRTKHTKHNTTLALAVQKQKNYVNAWQDEKEQDALRGITQEHRDDLKRLTESLRECLNPYQMTAIDIKVRKGAKKLGLNPLETMEYTIDQFKEALTQIKHDNG